MTLRNVSERFAKAALIAALMGICGGAESALADVEVEITEIRGAAAVKRAGTDEWVELKEGDKLKEGDVVRLPGNYSEVSWKRIDTGGCGNEGSVGTGLSKVKEVEVGKEIRSAAPPATYFHAVSDGGQSAGEVTITESGQCEGEEHCGVSSDLAAAAAADNTPDGHATVISLESNHDGQGYAQDTVIGNSPQSQIPIFTSSLFGSMSNQQLPIFPGEAIRWVRMGDDVVPFPETYHWAFCTADFNDDGVVDTRDVTAYINAWAARMPGADMNGDGTVNTLDVIQFLDAWSARC